MVIYITDKNENVIKIQKIDEENNDLRIGVYDLLKPLNNEDKNKLKEIEKLERQIKNIRKSIDIGLIKIYKKEKMENIMKFAEDYYKENYKNKKR